MTLAEFLITWTAISIPVGFFVAAFMAVGARGDVPDHLIERLVTELESEAGRDIGPIEHQALGQKVVSLRGSAG